MIDNNIDTLLGTNSVFNNNNIMKNTPTMDKDRSLIKGCLSSSHSHITTAKVVTTRKTGPDFRSITSSVDVCQFNHSRTETPMTSETDKRLDPETERKANATAIVQQQVKPTQMADERNYSDPSSTKKLQLAK
eukprot:Awhi_evm1s4415